MSIPTLITAALAFCGVLLYLLTFSLNAVGQQQINVMNSELSELKENNAALKSGMYDGAELERIKNIAMTKLGMVVPEEHQKVYIDIPKQNYFVQNDLETAATEAEASFDLFGFFN
jgi:cell division protein FtsL